MSRREELLDAVTDHVIEHGLIGLTLRPVAAAIGTSDRMLVYYFGGRDGLVAEVVARSEDRSIASIDAMPGAHGVRAGVNALWAAYQKAPLEGCMNLYVEAAATGLIGREPYLTAIRAANERWRQALERYLVRCGAPTSRVERVVTLIDSCLYGFHLDLTTDDPAELARGVDDLAAAAEILAETGRMRP